MFRSKHQPSLTPTSLSSSASADPAGTTFKAYLTLTPSMAPSLSPALSLMTATAPPHPPGDPHLPCRAAFWKYNSALCSPPSYSSLHTWSRIQVLIRPHSPMAPRSSPQAQRLPPGCRARGPSLLHRLTRHLLPQSLCACSCPAPNLFPHTPRGSLSPPLGLCSNISWARPPVAAPPPAGPLPLVSSPPRPHGALHSACVC